MIRCEVGLDVARSPSEVFAFVDDVSQAPRWLSRCKSIEQTSPPPKRVGSTLRYAYKEGGGAGTMDELRADLRPDSSLEEIFFALARESPASLPEENRNPQ